MKSIVEYLSTKVKNKEVLNNMFEFPKTPKTDEIIEFLEKNGFDKYEVGRISNNSSSSRKITIKDFYENMTNKRFGINKQDICVIIHFCLGGEINEDNPMFRLYTTNDGHHLTMTSSLGHGKFIGIAEEYNKIFKYFKTYDDFINEVNNFFGW